jgi:hypothetical protein
MPGGSVYSTLYEGGRAWARQPPHAYRPESLYTRKAWKSRCKPAGGSREAHILI